MKTAIKIIACLVFTVITLSAFNDRATAPATGYKAPMLTLENDSTSMTLEEMEGDYVLVTFWSAGDARSRLQCNEYSALLAGRDDIKLVAVNLDDSRGLFEEIVKRDNLTSAMQYHVEGMDAENISRSYQLDRGLRSFLVDPEGRISAIDPDAKTLTQLPG